MLIGPALAILLTAGLSSGCSTTPKAAPEPVVTARPATATAQANLRDYLSATRAGTWTYQRHALRDGSDRPTVDYIRRSTPQRLLEGDTTWNIYRAIDRRLARIHGRDQIRRLPQPDGSYTGFILRFRLAEPAALIPEDLTFDRPSVVRTPLEYMDLERHPRGRGTLTRTATIEGFEDVVCPAGHFEDCLRVRIDLDIDIHWGPDIDWTMHVWLSPRVGEVRRVQQLAGWLLIFPFGSTFEYELVSYTPPTTTQPALNPAPLWTEGLIAFDRSIPHPSLGALLVYFEEPPLVGQIAEK